MIKLIRNIRKKLIAQGKTTNYIKYALGEIVLVVIGILIALQVNNWNENRISYTKKEKLLHALRIEGRGGYVNSQNGLPTYGIPPLQTPEPFFWSQSYVASILRVTQRLIFLNLFSW